ncbi:MAG: glycosyltransferase family 4 protein [Saccharofermentanales bacterium]|jgi:glycosyltransferase involved in cell wall biosynthesis
MRILFLDAYFEPEQIAFTHLENDLLEGLVRAGHEVEIVCPTPTRGVSPIEVQEYKNRKDDTLHNGHVHVTRFLAPQEGKNPLIRALRYFWCNLRTYQIGKRMDGIDAVFANSTPPTQGWIAGRVAQKKRIPFVYSLQDIFPDSLVTTGLTKQDSFLWKIGRKLEKVTYKRCSHIIVISEEMKKNLLQKNIRAKKISVISNWINMDEIYPIEKEKNALFDEFGINRNKYIVLYAGNFGAAQGAEIVLDVAEELQTEQDIQFVIFGSGAGYSEAEKRAEKLKNVFIHPLLPQHRVPEVYSMGDVAIITCKKGVGKSGMPSKTWSIMACNIPIIASFDVDSELSNILKNSNTGVSVEPESICALVDEIRCFYKKKKKVDGRAYVKINASKDHCVKKYIDTILEATM